MAFRLVVFLLSSVAVTAKHFNTNCDVSPNALTEQFSVNIQQSCITVSRQKRCYYTYIPSCATDLTPVVYDIHGYGECPSTFSAYSGWFEKATKECFVVVWPMGKVERDVADAPCWSVPGGLKYGSEDDDETDSCCCHKENEPLEVSSEDGGDDVEFLNQIAFYLARDIPFISDGKVEMDTQRIYMSGHANGCLLAHAMAAFHSDLVAAVACMAGMPITKLPTSYDPVPTWTVAGALDEIMPPGGLRTTDNHIMFPGHQQGFEYLLQAHACSNVYNNSTAVPEMDLPDYPMQGTLLVQTAFGCMDGAVVQHFTLVTGGHLLYKGTSEIYPDYGADTTLDTTSMAWSFMTSFESRHEPLLQQKINLTDIQHLLEEDQEESIPIPADPLEPPLIDEDSSTNGVDTAESIEESEADHSGVENKEDDTPTWDAPDVDTQEEEEKGSKEDDVESKDDASPWQGLRGPGISLEQALNS